MYLTATARLWEVRLYGLPARKAFGAFCVIGLQSLLAGSPATAQAPVPQDIQAALQHTTELMRAPLHVDVQFDYTMTARPRRPRPLFPTTREEGTRRQVWVTQ